MFYVDSAGQSKWLTSLKTGKRYYFTGHIEGEDWQRAARKLEQDDTPEPEPPVVNSKPHPQPKPVDFGASVRIKIDEMKLEQLRK